MTCRELMTSDPAHCVPRDTVVTAAILMKSHDVGSVPVVADRYSMLVIGMVTDRDITLRVVAEQRDYYNTHVEDVMSKDVVTCKADDDYDEVIAAMKEHQIRRVPVIDVNKKLVGIIALADVAREAEEPEQVAKTVQQVSRPAEPESQNGGKTRFTRTGLLVAGGLGIGAGLIYLLDPRWARRAASTLKETVSHMAGGGMQSSEHITEDIHN